MGNAPAHMNASQIFQNEDIYRLIMEHTRDLIRVIDVDFNFVYVSPSHETVLGYTVDEMLHGSGLDILHPDDKDTAISMHRQMITE
ncbi:MAG: PAS domain S-box protein, partial [Firmicutes bacterium]|nr:PAS domain S-box protein [Bacillota bacterium]